MAHYFLLNLFTFKLFFYPSPKTAKWWFSILTLLFKLPMSFVTAVFLILEIFSINHFFQYCPFWAFCENYFFSAIVFRDSILSSLEQCISNVNVNMNHLGTLLKCIFWFSGSGVRSRMLHSNKLFGYDDENDADLQITHWVARL